MKNLFFILAFILASFIANAQSSINVTNYGVVGDATNFTVTTTYGSPVVSSTNHWMTNTTVGKVIEVFGVRTNSYISPTFNYFTNNSDIICYVTNVVNETNLYLSQICQVNSNVAVCIVGSNNQTNFQNAIVAAENLLVGGVTSVTINIPAGNYLLVNGTNQLSTSWVPPFYTATYPTLYINSGGLIFKGVGTNTVLMGCGAAVPRIDAINDNNGVFRGCMFYIEATSGAGQSGAVTNASFPIVFQDLIADGAALTDNSNPANSTRGWDVTADFLNYSNLKGTNGNALTVYTNLIVRNWGGENIKGFGWDGGVSPFIDIANCSFSNCPASALNPDYATHVHGCTFINMNKIQEITQHYWVFPTIFENNTATNIAGQGYTVTGAAVGLMQPCTIRSNIFNGANVSSGYGANLTITGNLFNNLGGDMVDFVAVSPQGTLGYSSNIVITLNTFLASSDAAIYFGGQIIYNLYCSNNVNATYKTQGGSDFPTGSGIGLKTNIVFTGNDNRAAVPFSVTVGSIGGLTAGAEGDSRNTTNTYFIVSNNIPAVSFRYDWSFGTNAVVNNLLTYGLGSVQRLVDSPSPALVTNASWCLDNLHAVSIPRGAFMTVTNASSKPQTIYSNTNAFLGDFSGPTNIIAVNGSLTYYWFYPNWQTNSTPPTFGSGPFMWRAF